MENIVFLPIRKSAEILLFCTANPPGAKKVASVVIDIIPAVAVLVVNSADYITAVDNTASADYTVGTDCGFFPLTGRYYAIISCYKNPVAGHTVHKIIYSSPTALAGSHKIIAVSGNIG